MLKMFMRMRLIKHFSSGSTFVFLVVLALLVVGAMFFGDKGADFLGGNKRKATQSMELQGNWLGMRLASLDSPTARSLGVPPSARGVTVVELDGTNGWRARQAGVMPGDVIVAVDGEKVRDLADLYDVSRNVEVASAVMLDVRRGGLPMTLALPAAYAAPAVGGQPQAWQGGQPVPMATQGADAGGAQPVAWAPWYNCAVHNRAWPQGAVHPHYRCLIGNCPLNRVR